MKSTELARRLGVSPSSVRNYATEYAAYLDARAQTRDGATRVFGELDARIIAEIARLRTENVSPDEIHAHLQLLQAGGWLDLPTMPAPADPTVDPFPLVPKEAADTALALQRQALLAENARLSDRAEDLQERLDIETTAHAVTRAALLETVAKLGRAEGELTSWFWTRRLLLVALALLLVLALAALAVALAG